ncbi:unnamed protein product [Cuscuta campestris]|uniref:Protein WEAK CHLOROPLAST MOVEMENT UNDER BLUE LIGHT 1 n=1 Tax=Cuscuta campestris TaxID=132261 RepID=A0A484KCT4_9ASTE|nr:unnamed protein product [Cuscuta campestris]
MEEVENMKRDIPSESFPGTTEVTSSMNDDSPDIVFETDKSTSQIVEFEARALPVDDFICDHPRQDQNGSSTSDINLVLNSPSEVDNCGTMGTPVNSSALEDESSSLNSISSDSKPVEALQPLVDTSDFLLADSESAKFQEGVTKEHETTPLNPAIDLLGDIITSQDNDTFNDDHLTSSHPEMREAAHESVNQLLPLDPDGVGHLQANVSDHLEPSNDIDMPVTDFSNQHTEVPVHVMPLDGAVDQHSLAKVSTHLVPSHDDDDDHDDDARLRQAKISSFAAKQSASFPSNRPENAGIDRVQIDTAMPIESVKHAVSKFGGIVDWKAHRVQTVERRKCIDQELEKLQEEIPIFKKQCEESEEAKMQVLKELDGTRRLIEELKLNLERAQTEEQQARQDSELAKLRVEEMEQGIADEASIATKAQLEVAKARHASAVSELQAVRSELEQLREDYAVLVSERDAAVRKAEEAVSESKEVEKCVEDLTVELITMKQNLEAAHAAHLEAEDHRIGADLAREQDTLYWEEEVKKAEDEISRLNQQILSANELKSDLQTASALLHDLKAELAAYMETKPQQHEEADAGRTHSGIQAAVESTRREIEELKLQAEKAASEVNCLRLTAASLETELEREKAELAGTQQREEMVSISAASIEAELNRTISDISLAQIKEKEAREKMVELTKQLQVVAQDANQAKSLAEARQAELWRAKEEAEQAKAEANTIDNQLHAVHKEIEAAKAAEKLALAAMNALEESESARKNKEWDSPTGVKISLEEYYELSKQTHAAEEEANARIAAAMSQIDVAKESELKSMKKLEDVNQQLAEKKKALETAVQKAEEAKGGKLAVEQELRKWREVHEERRRISESVNRNSCPRLSFEDRKEHDASILHHRSPKGNVHESNHENPFTQEGSAEHEPSLEATKTTKKKRRSFFPRIFMFLARKKSSKTA